MKTWLCLQEFQVMEDREGQQHVRDRGVYMCACYCVCRALCIFVYLFRSSHVLIALVAYVDTCDLLCVGMLA